MTGARWIIAFQYAAGLCDTCTGLLLIAAPELAVRMMRVETAPSPIVFLSYIGVFVLAVGLSYLWIAWRSPLSQETALAWKTQWQITALIRSAIAVFLAVAIAAHQLDIAWLLVAFTDGVVACIQWLGLYRGWLAHGR